MQILPQLHAFIWDSYTQNNCNTYLIDGAKRILIDPGHIKLFGHVEKGLEEIGLKKEDIDVVFCTHAHPDHMEALKIFKPLPAVITMHEEEWRLVTSMSKHLNVDLSHYEPDFFVREGNLSLSGIELNIYHSPGHSPGSATLYWPQQKVLFTGDVIFQEGLGRTDLPGGNGEQLKESIRQLAKLDVDYILPGHGEIVSGNGPVRANFQMLEQFWFARI